MGVPKNSQVIKRNSTEGRSYDYYSYPAENQLYTLRKEPQLITFFSRFINADTIAIMTGPNKELAMVSTK